MEKRRALAIEKINSYVIIANDPVNDVHHTPVKGKGYQFGGYCYEKVLPITVSEKSTKNAISIINGVDWIYNGVKYELKTNCSTIGTIIDDNNIVYPMFNSDFVIYNPFNEVSDTPEQMIEKSIVIRPSYFIDILDRLNMLHDLRPYRNKVQINSYKNSKKKTEKYLSMLYTLGIPAKDIFFTENDERLFAENVARLKKANK